MEKWRQYRQTRLIRPAAPPGRRHRRPPRWTMVATVAMGVVVALGWLVLASPVFRIATVEAAGELTPAVQERIERLRGQNIFRLSESRLERELVALEPTVASVRLTRGLPTELRVTVTRRHPALVWQTDMGVWAIDETGVAFGFDETLAAGIPRVIDRRVTTVTPGAAYLPPEFVAVVRRAFAELPARLGGTVIEAEVAETLASLRVGTEWGWSVYLDTRRPVHGQLENLTLVLREYRDQIHDYVDLRVPGWGYVK